MSNGVSIKGDEFRRVIIQPVDGVSTSQWRSVYFYREPTFDSIDLKTTYNPSAVELLTANKEYLKDETIAWIETQIATNAGIWNGFTYDKKKFDSYIFFFSIISFFTCFTFTITSMFIK